MKKIFKVVLPVRDTVIVLMQKGSKILSIQSQNQDLVAWFTCDPTAPLVNVTFRIAGTGHDEPHVGIYLATVQHNYGRVWHVYYCVEERAKG